MDTDALHVLRAEAIARQEFPQPGPPDERAALTKRNETRLGLAALADMYLKQAEQRRRVDNEMLRLRR